MLKTVIFDMDGVIVDTEPVHHFAYHQLFNQLGITVSPDLYASFTGNSTKNIFQKLKAQFELSQSVEELVQAKRDLFNDAFDHKDDLTLLDGVERLIKELKANDIQLILASSSAKVTIQRVFNRFQLFPYFLFCFHKLSYVTVCIPLLIHVIMWFHMLSPVFFICFCGYLCGPRFSYAFLGVHMFSYAFICFHRF